MSRHPSESPTILRPANPIFIGFTLVFAFVLNMIPWGRDWVVPDFLALVLIFWVMKQPRMVGMGTAWLFGMMMDVHQASLLGEHALAYSLMSYFAITLHRRVPWFGMAEQMLHILPLFLIAQGTSWLVNMATGGMTPSPWIFLSSVFSTLLWPIAHELLMAPQRVPMDQDENRPI